ncbi:hypothetical protein CASFOL_003619 [Castilleja foliolosa]
MGDFLYAVSGDQLSMRDWANLPEELLSLILSNLFAKDKHDFVLVCKSWNKSAKFSPFRHSPCLMFYERSNYTWKLFQYNSFFSMALPQHLNRADIRCAKHGWMLVTKPDYTMFFYDPFNNETIHLCKLGRVWKVLCFFHPPTHPDCFIIGISSMVCTKDVEIGILRRGENEWSKSVYQSKSDFKLSVCTPVLLHQQQLLHFLDMGGDIGTFDVGKSGSSDSWTVQSKCLWPSRLRGKIQQHFLIELWDERVLLSVLVMHEERKVNVFRLLVLPENRMRWDPVEDLGDKVLYVSHTASFAATAPRQSMANRIYFAKMHGDDDDVVFYCLSTRRYRTCKCDFSSKKSYGFRDLSFATWITATPTPEFPRDLTW